jgi:orotate phosphoribosyltransferase
MWTDRQMTLLESTVLDKLREASILREGHFAFRSGRHGECLVDRDLLLADPAIASRFGYDIAKHYFTNHVEIVATPSIWGAGLAQWVGYFLEPKAKVVDATPSKNGLSIAEKLVPLIKDRRVLLVDNLILTGDTIATFVDIVRGLGATAIGIAALWSSADPTIQGLPAYAVLSERYPVYVPDECPLCRQGTIPIEKIGY